MKDQIIVGCLVLLIAQVGMAGEWYGDLTYTNSDGDLPNTPFNKVNNNDTGWQISAGYEVNRHLSLEMGYVDFGQQNIQLEPSSLVLNSNNTNSDTYFNPFSSQHFVVDSNRNLVTNPTPSSSTTAPITPTLNAETSGLRLASIGTVSLTSAIALNIQAGALVPRYKVTRQSTSFDLGVDGSIFNSVTTQQSETSYEPELFVGMGLHWKVNTTMGVKVFWEKINDLGNEDTFEQDIDTYNLALRYQF